MEVIGYVGTLLMGILLGVVGGGGSILTIPILVYLFKIDPLIAITYSLFIVGFSSVFGALRYMKFGSVNWKAVLLFGIPSIIAVFATRTFVAPFIPDFINFPGLGKFEKSTTLLVLFALLMLIASISMIRTAKSTTVSKSNEKAFNYPIVLMQGLAVGFITGLVGAGGGFLIIPALVSWVKLPMKTAVGTSLVIISINSLAGFLFSLEAVTIDWTFLLIVTGIGVGGIQIGSGFSKRIEGTRLKPAFGWFILLTGIYILLKEGLFH